MTRSSYAVSPRGSPLRATTIVALGSLLWSRSSTYPRSARSSSVAEAASGASTRPCASRFTTAGGVSSSRSLGRARPIRGRSSQIATRITSPQATPNRTGTRSQVTAAEPDIAAPVIIRP
jgi:hypothetical protein